jgi:kumamolisin
MKPQSKVKLTGSTRPVPANATLSDVNKDEIIEVTIRLRRQKALPQEAISGGKHLTREAYADEFAASSDEAEKVEAFAHDHHLSTVEVNLGRRSVIVKGRAEDIEEAFGVTLKCDSTNGSSFRIVMGDIHVPEELKDVVTGVFGLDDRPIASPKFKVKRHDGNIVSHAAAPAAFTPDQLAKIYGFPTGVTGSGQCIAIIELGGGFRTSDLKTYFSELKIKMPTVKSISVDGGANIPSTADGADGEVMLDIEVAGAVAPGATIAVYFARNTDKGFLDAITKAIHDTQNKPSVISISWGSAEVAWTQQAMTNYNESFKTAAALGITVCVAAGDTGSADSVTDGKAHVDFPASSPYVLACGGTKLTTNNNGQITAETVWHESSDSATGGGVSDFFPLPDYQANANVPLSLNNQFKGRGVPDVAGDADPDTGYKVRVDGQEMVVGGTSAVAPLMAGFIALVNQQRQKSAGFINPAIYADPSSCRDITSGDNKTVAGNVGFTAGPGWDACTGLGVLSKLPEVNTNVPA